MNSLLLNGLDLEWFEFLVEHLTKIHNDRLVDLLPQMGTEDLDQTDFQCRNLAMHEDASQIELYLETNIYVGAIDSWTPPKCKSSIGDLV